MTDTKQRIFEAAVFLFANESYHTVTLKDIARKADIKAPSIYNHYDSKDAILQAVYHYFDSHMAMIMPNLDKLMKMVDTHHPHEVLASTNVVFSPEILPIMARAMLITASMVHSDERADHLVNKNLIEMPYKYDPPLLEKMMERNKIHPIDPDQFTLVHSCFCHSAAIRMYSNHILDSESWSNGLQTIYSLVKPIA